MEIKKIYTMRYSSTLIYTDEGTYRTQGELIEGIFYLYLRNLCDIDTDVNMQVNKYEQIVNASLKFIENNPNYKKVEWIDWPIIQKLPKFKYHPNLYSCDIVHWYNDYCQCCGKKINAYISTMYTKEDIKCICLDCISNGSAAQKFNGRFVESFEKNVSDPAKVNELLNRTPGYAFMKEHWLTCCDDFCEFIGYYGTKQLDLLNITDEVLEEYIKRRGIERLEIIDENNNNLAPLEVLKMKLDKDGSYANNLYPGYLFRCLHCKKYHLDIGKLFL